MTTHAKLSASGSHRWIYCPGSVRLEEGIKDSSSFHAQEGTLAHELAEKCLTDNSPPEQHLGDIRYGITITEEMCEHVAGYVAYVKSFSGEHFYEERVDFSKWVPEGFGTSDAIVIDEVNSTCHVIDLKYGKGKEVEAENNTQAICYALGVHSDHGWLYDIDKYVMHIYQPRISNFSTWELSLDELMEWGEFIRKQADRCLSDDAPFNPGEKQCQWCKAKASCPALYQFTQETISADFDKIDEELISPDKVTNERLKTVLQSKKLIEGYLQAVEEHVKDKLKSGEPFPGYKLVAGRSMRKYRDEEEAQIKLIDLLGDDAFEKTLLSPAKAEKALGSKRKKELNDIVIKPEGAPTLVPDSDKRKSIFDNEDDFESLDND